MTQETGMSIRIRTVALALIAGAALSACTTVPETIVQRPTSTRPQTAPVAPAANGSIFQAASYRPLFGDRRASMVGDVLTIVINEKTSAGKTGSATGDKASNASYGVKNLLGLNPAVTAGLGVGANANNKYEDKSASTSSNNFTGTLTVTVNEVLPNGNLAVSGEKQVAFDKGAEYIRFSGTVNPDTILNGNQVSSTQVADARLEYRSNTRIDPVEMMSQLGRFFLSVMPF
jgi:flagellar L-ring protein precursor FlgH